MSRFAPVPFMTAPSLSYPRPPPRCATAASPLTLTAPAREEVSSGCASPGLICLGRTRQHRGPQGVLVLQHAAPRRVPTGGRDEEVSGGGDKQVWLPLLT